MIQRLTRIAHAITSRVGPCLRWLNRVRRLALPRLDTIARRRYDRPLVRDKTSRDDEFVGTSDASLCDIERALAAAGFQRNALSTLKFVESVADGDRTYESASWAKHDGEVQYHVWVYELDGRRVVDAHRETSYLHSAAGHQGHSDDPHYAPADPDGVVAEALEPVGLERGSDGDV